ARLTKYNVGAGDWRRPIGATQVILVPGQVESDASLAWGAPGLRRNAELLQAVREANPGAWIVYKPHPDVVAGLRGQDGSLTVPLAEHCNEQVVDVPMAALLDRVDEVHTLTSLAGFEALLRGKKVVCYGLPFYAGWGLTDDRLPLPAGRRRRALTLDELVAGALLLYPCYLSRRTGRFTTAERTLDELCHWREQGVSRMPWWRRALRVVLGAWARWKGR
ncbi:MAG: capsular polysaccharide biosynthesis protein, partial [Alphaproteobacteria bacterium]